MAIFIWTLFKDHGWGLIIYFTLKGRIWLAFSYTIWMSLHWQFTSYYLQSACLFRMTFRAQCDEDWDKVRKRKRCLRVQEFFIYFIFLAIFCYLFITNGNADRKSSETWDSVWFFFS